MSEKMSTERAAEILDPKHREGYESLAIVEEACQMGRDGSAAANPAQPLQKGLCLSELRFQRLPVRLLRQTEQVLRQLRAGHFVGG